MKSTVLLSIAMGACAAGPNAVAKNENGGSFSIEGVYRYIDGDRIVWDCGKSEKCIDVLVRDARLSASATSLIGRKINLRVKRVKACGDESSQVACLRSRDGTALIIVEWLSPSK
jgi:hypothetical protein